MASMKPMNRLASTAAVIITSWAALVVAVPMISLPGGTFDMGNDDKDAYEADMEGPVRQVSVKAFQIGETEVTNAEFKKFVQKTHYVTDAEKFGWSFCFAPLVSKEIDDAIDKAVMGSPWWLPVNDSTWLHPDGPDSTIDDRMDHPVVHVSWNDCKAFCEWDGGRLPGEEEWEYAARGGKVRRRFPWGNREDDLYKRANTFEGEFPYEIESKDGYRGTAPVKSYPPNQFGLYDVAGNAWEWVDAYYGPQDRTLASMDPSQYIPGQMPEIHVVQRGGSFLCHRSYCYRYRVSARAPNTKDSSAQNTGCRCARGQGASAEL